MKKFRVLKLKLTVASLLIVPKNISWRKLVHKFRRLGFDGPYSGGRHLFMVNGKLKIHIPNPHKNDIGKHLVAEILRQAEISADDWDRA